LIQLLTYNKVTATIFMFHSVHVILMKKLACCILQCLSNAYKYQLSLTNPRDALHHDKHAANKGGRSV